MQLEGAWLEALEEARRAGHRSRRRGTPTQVWPSTARRALSPAGRVRGSRGGLPGREQVGWEPQPGLAQLRLAQGRKDAAAAAIRRAAGEIAEPLKRAGLLAAYAEIMLAVHDRTTRATPVASSARSPGATRAACSPRWSSRLGEPSSWPEGEPRPALVSLRSAWRLWHELDAPYEAARARVLVGLACRALGDNDAAASSSRPHAASSRRSGRRRISRSSTRSM